MIASAREGSIRLETGPESQKDYVHVDDVCEVLPRIARSGSHRIYNVASGTNMSHRSITRILADATSCSVSIESGAPTVKAPPISIQRICTEFDFRPRPLGPALHELVSADLP
jgi:nucleoside-diphosphate-sugar epimerase